MAIDDGPVETMPNMSPSCISSFEIFLNRSRSAAGVAEVEVQIVDDEQQDARAVQENPDDAAARRRHVGHGPDRPVVDRHRRQLRHEAFRRGDEEDHRQRPQAERDDRGAQSSQGPSEVRYRAHVAFSTAYDLVSKMEKNQQPPQGGGLRLERLRFQPVSRRPGRRRIMGSNQSRTRATGRRHVRHGSVEPAVRRRRPGPRAVGPDRAANRANTTFYTIDPRIGGPDLDEKVDPGG